jgi:translocation and assembly module TamB
VLEGLALDAQVATPASAPRGTARLRATLDGLPVALDFRGRPDGQAVEIEAAEARLGPAQLTATGRLDPAAQLFTGTARLEAADLAPLGRLAGLAGLAGRLALDATLEPRDGVQGFDLKLDAPRLAYAGQQGSLAATVAGTPAALDWTVRGKATQGELSGRGRLAAAEGAYRLDLAALQAETQGETIRLAGPARITYGADGGIEVANLALAIGNGGRVQAAGRWGPERADLGLTIAALPLSLAERFAPDLKPQGMITGEVRATGPTAKPEIRARLNGTGLGLGADWARGLPPVTLRAEASMAGNAAEARAEIAAGPAGTVTATARLPSGFGTDDPLAASLDGTLNLAPLAGPFLASGADRVAGRLALALRAEGSLDNPRLGGRATLTGGSYRNPTTGVRLSEIGGIITGEGTRLVIERLEGKTLGNGTIGIRGSIDAGAPGLPADLVITARNARPVASDLGTATIGADITVKGPITGGGAVAGEVRIEQAELRVPEKLPANVPTLANVRQRGPLPPGVLPPGAAARQGRRARLRRPAHVARGEGDGPPRLHPRAGARGGDGRRHRHRRHGGRPGPLRQPRAGPRHAQRPDPHADLQARHDQLQRRYFHPAARHGGRGDDRHDDHHHRRHRPGQRPADRLHLHPRAAAGRGAGPPALRPCDQQPLAIRDRPDCRRRRPAHRPRRLRRRAARQGEECPRLDRLGVSGAQGNTAGATVEAGRYVAPGVFLGVRQGTNGGQTGVGVQVEITPRIKIEGQTATGPAGDRIGLSYELEY